MKRQTKAEPRKAVKSYDELDAVRDVSAILERFDPPMQDRILRWVQERRGTDSLSGIQVSPSLLLHSEPARQAVKAAKPLRNPHEMAKPPLNKVIIQDDDDEGVLIGIPRDADMPEPEGIDLLKPKGPARKLVTKKFKDGSTAVVME
jgi:hypothetical protein